MPHKRLLIISIIALLIMGLIGGILYYIRGQIGNLFVTAPAPVTGRIIINATILHSGTLTYNNSKSLVEYALLNYSSFNVSRLNLSIAVYNENPLPKIYVVNTNGYCISCFDAGSIYRYLSSDLTNYGVILNQSSISMVSISSLSTTSPDSIIVIPSGLMPLDLMPFSGVGDNFTILNLLSMGDSVVYIGQNFSRAVGYGGTVFVTSGKSSLALANVGLSTLPAVQSFVSNESDGIIFNNPTFRFATGYSYGSVSAVNASNGTIIALSNYPSTSWSNEIALSSDIARVIYLRFWMGKLSYGNYYYNVSLNSSGQLPIFSTNKTIPNLPGIVPSTYPVIIIKAYNDNGFVTKQIPFSSSFIDNGIVSMQENIGEGENIPIYVNVRNSTATLSLHLSIYNSTLHLAASVPVGFVNASFGIIKYPSFILPPGYYISSLQGFNNNEYGSSLFQIRNITITPIALDFRNNSFIFHATSNNFPVSNLSYQATINGAHSESGTINNGVIKYILPRGSIIRYGQENFVFRIINQNYTFSTSYQSQSVHIPAIYIEFGVAGLIVILLNIILRPPTKDEYYVDVPDFQPTSKAKVKTSKESVVNIFDSVNYYYHWKYMPLTAEEVKAGISTNIRDNSMPVSITQQNVLAILNKLVSQGLIVQVGDYYAPKSWIANSRHDIEYLVIFRELRDYFVSHATLFTDLDQSQLADIVVTKRGVQNLIIIYSSSSGMRKINVSPESRIFIIFLNEETRIDFMNRIYISYGQDAEILKMGISYSYIRLVDVSDLDQISL